MEEFIKLKNSPSIFLKDVAINTDPLVISAIMLQLAASQIPVAGGVASALKN